VQVLLHREVLMTLVWAPSLTDKNHAPLRQHRTSQREMCDQPAGRRRDTPDGLVTTGV
jgi:hypothetical protein